MSNEVTVKSGGGSFLGLLGLMFIGLKLLKIITWPWIWVLAPLWLGAALTLVILFVILVIGILAAITN